MALLSKAGSFSTTTAVATTTVPLTGFGFTPKAIVLWWSGRTDTSDAVGAANHQRGFGVAVSASSRHAITSQSQNGQAAAVADQGCLDTACVYTLTTAGATDGLLDVQSMDADGVTFIIDDAFATSLRVHYIAYGGDSITNVARGTFTELAAPGTQNVTVGFTPDVVFSMHTATGGNPASGSDSRIGIGFAATPWANANNICWTGGTNDAATTMQALAYCRSGECVAMLDSTVANTNSRYRITGTTSTQFTVDQIEGSVTSRTQFYLAIGGGKWAAGSFLTETSTSTDITETGLGFEPRGVLLLSACRAENAADTVSDHDAWSMGAFDATSDIAQGVMDEDATANSEVGTAIRFADCYVNLDTASAVEGAAHKTAIGQDGFTMRMTDADPSQSFVGWVAAGSNVIDPPRSKFDRIRRDTTTRM